MITLCAMTALHRRLSCKARRFAASPILWMGRSWGGLSVCKGQQTLSHSLTHSEEHGAERARSNCSPWRGAVRCGRQRDRCHCAGGGGGNMNGAQEYAAVRASAGTMPGEEVLIVLEAHGELANSYFGSVNNVQRSLGRLTMLWSSGQQSRLGSYMDARMHVGGKGKGGGGRQDMMPGQQQREESPSPCGLCRIERAGRRHGLSSARRAPSSLRCASPH